MWNRGGGSLFYITNSASTATYLLQLLFLSLFSSHGIIATNTSSCGNIPNIACPFYVRDDQKCHNHSLIQELDCRDGRLIIKLNLTRDEELHEFYVEDINNQKSTLHLVNSNLSQSSPFAFDYHSADNNTSITFIECPLISSNSPAPAPAPAPVSDTSTSDSPLTNHGGNQRYSFVAGDMILEKIDNGCKVSHVAWVSTQWPRLRDRNFTSSKAEDIHQEVMTYGFDVSWKKIICANCAGRCIVGPSKSYRCDLSTCSFRNQGVYKYQPSFKCLGKHLKDIAGYIMDHPAKSYCTLLFLGVKFLCGLSLLIASVVYMLKKRHLSMYDTIEDFLQGQNNLMPIRYSFSDIKKITNGFKEKLGEGGFGTVYKGKLRSGLVVAVKIIKTTEKNSKNEVTTEGKEFIREVATIGRIHHVNVVQLIGFCFQGSKRALIYEFMPNGSLEKYIFPVEEKGQHISLSCESMYEISYKVAGGIDYLHRGCDMQILHFDIKPHNILLDKDFNPKISDFGLAKLCATDDSLVNVSARGTNGYIAPELLCRYIGGVSYKADVYSFGKMMLEMAGRRRNFSVDHGLDHGLSQIYFPQWIFDQMNKGKDINTKEATAEETNLTKKMIIVGLWCIQLKPSERPSMNKVIEMLDGDVELLVMPPARPVVDFYTQKSEEDQEAAPPPEPIVPSQEITEAGPTVPSQEITEAESDMTTDYSSMSL